MKKLKDIFINLVDLCVNLGVTQPVASRGGSCLGHFIRCLLVHRIDHILYTSEKKSAAANCWLGNFKMFSRCSISSS